MKSKDSIVEARYELGASLIGFSCFAVSGICSNVLMLIVSLLLCAISVLVMCLRKRIVAAIVLFSLTLYILFRLYTEWS